jgi:aminoglycoside/choline kinase family phosphotransferase
VILSDHTIDALTPQAVTAMLRSSGRFGDVAVYDVAASEIGTGQMANSYRLELSYSAGPDDAPTSIITKVPSMDETSRQMAEATTAYLREVRFYQRIASSIGTRTPQCLYAEIADDTVGFVILLEDLGPALAVDQLSGCDADQAALALGEAAALHGSSWRRGYLHSEHWLPAENVWNMLGAAVPHVTEPWLDRFGKFLDPDHVTAVTRLGDEVGTWLKTLTNHRTLWHGDFRLDNMLFDAKGGTVPVAVVDWQSVAAAPGIIDVSYFLGNSLPEADRAKYERDLVNEYHQRLLSHGVENYSAEQCWREYQAHALFGLVLTIPVSMGVQTTERGDAMFGAMARRAAEQIIANDSYAALEALEASYP